MINIIVVGVNGKMGQVICRIAEESGSAKVVCGIDVNAVEKNGFPVYPSFDRVNPRNVTRLLIFRTPPPLRAHSSTLGAKKSAP